MNEFDAIERLRRIAVDPGARGLRDDAAILGDLVLTHDTIAENVHFLSSDPPASVGWKLAAVNLSDLAGKGADPVAALLSLTLVGDDDWEDGFIGGVEAACESYGLQLVGGDTISLPDGSPRVLGMTAIGRAGGQVPSRAGGDPGDLLWLVGTLGDGAAGLALLLDDPEATGPLVDTYRRPVPHLAAGRELAAHAKAMMDVSDGLLLDAKRLAEASGCSADIDLDALPLSSAFVAERGNSQRSRLFAATGGDDYALLVALPADFDPALSLSLPSGLSVTAIGTLAETAASPLLLRSGGRPVQLPEQLGHEHRSIPAAPMADRP